MKTLIPLALAGLLLISGTSFNLPVSAASDFVIYEPTQVIALHTSLAAQINFQTPDIQNIVAGSLEQLNYRLPDLQNILPKKSEKSKVDFVAPKISKTATTALIKGFKNFIQKVGEKIGGIFRAEISSPPIKASIPKLSKESTQPKSDFNRKDFAAQINFQTPDIQNIVPQDLGKSKVDFVPPTISTTAVSIQSPQATGFVEGVKNIFQGVSNAIGDIFRREAPPAPINISIPQPSPELLAKSATTTPKEVVTERIIERTTPSSPKSSIQEIRLVIPSLPPGFLFQPQQTVSGPQGVETVREVHTETVRETVTTVDNTALNALSQSVNQQLAALSQTISQSAVTANNLGISDNDVPDTITASRYLLLSGGNLFGSFNNATNTSGFGTSSPWTILSVEQKDSGDQTLPAFVVSDSGTSTPSFVVLNGNGYVGVATRTPMSTFAVGGVALFGGSGTSTFDNGLKIGGAVKVGSLDIVGECNGCGTAFANVVESGSNTGVGTSSPWGVLSVEQISSGDELLPAFVIGDQGTKTPALFVSNHSNIVGIATNTPNSTLEVGGSAYISSGLTLNGIATLYDGALIKGSSIQFGPPVSEASNNITSAHIFRDSTQGRFNLSVNRDSNGNVPSANSSANIVLWAGDTSILDSYFSVSFAPTNGQQPVERLRLDSSGGLKIGGTGIQGSIGLGNGITATSTLSGGYGKLGLGTTSPMAQFAIETAQGVVGSSTPIFVIGDSGSSTVFTVSGNDGSIGVGTSTPGTRFDVAGDGLFKGGLYVQATTTTSSLIATSTAGIGTTTPGGGTGLTNALSVGGNTYISGGLGVGVATTSSGGLFVKGSADIYDGLIVRGGIVGIASDTPGTRFDVVGNGLFKGGLYVQATTTTSSLIATSTLEIRGSDGSSKPAFQVADDRVGLATSTPGSLLSVQGLANIGSLYNEGELRTSFIVSTSTSNSGFGTSSPWAKLGIEIDSGVDAKTPAFAISDSGTSSPLLVVDYQGRIGVSQRDPRYSIHIGAIATSSNPSATNPLSITPSIGFSSTNTPSSTYGGYWSKFGGDGTDNETGTGWTDSTYESVRSMAVYDGKFYVGLGQTVGDATVWEYNPITNVWTKIGGDNVNSSWLDTTYEQVKSMTTYNGKLYAGLSQTAGDAEVWEYNGSTWTKIGGDAVNSSWADATYEYVWSMISYKGKLYVGLGASAGDAEVWEYNGSIWRLVGGDAVNSSWADATYDIVTSMGVYNGKLYAGLSITAGEAEVWEYNGSTWTKIGGDAVNSSWADATYERVASMTTYNGKLYAGLSHTAGDAEVWEYNGVTWRKIGGDAVNSSWADATYEFVFSMVTHNGKLYAGLGDDLASAGDAEVWEYNGATWKMIGGDAVNSSWADGTYEGVEVMFNYNGKLYAGLGDSAAGKAEVWEFVTDTMVVSQNGPRGVAIGNEIFVGYQGNVGIGTYEPQTKLDVYGGLSVNGSTLIATSSRVGIGTSTPWGLFSIEHQYTTNNQTTGSLYDDDNLPVFAISDVGSTTSFMVRNSDGFVGVGTATPSDRFVVAGSGLFKGGLYVQATTTTSSLIATSTAGIGTTTPGGGTGLTNALSVDGNTYVSGGLGVGAATTSPGGLFVKGSADIYDGLIVRGGKVGIGNSNPAAVLNVGDSASSGGGDLFVVAKALSGATVRQYIANTSDTANSNADIIVSTAGSSAGDPLLNLSTSASNWSIGVRNSDSDKLYITNVAGLASAERMVLSSVVDGLGATVSRVGINNTSPAAMLNIGAAGSSGSTIDHLAITNSYSGNPVRTYMANTSNTANSNVDLIMGVGGASGGDPYINFSVPSATDWSIGLRNTDSDKFYITSASGLGSNARLVIDTSGNLGIATDTPTARFEVTGNGLFKGGLYVQATTTTSSLIATSTLEVRGSGGVAAPDLVVFDGQTALGASNPSYKLQVMGTGLFQSNLDIGGSSNQGTINVGNGISATSTLSGEYGKLGLGTTSPYAQFAIEAVQGVVGSSTPIFAVGDSGTSTLMTITGDMGNVGFGTSAPYGAFTIEAGNRPNMTGITNAPIFAVSAFGTATPLFSINNANGKVAIGKQVAGYRLSVQENITTAANLAFFTNGAGEGLEIVHTGSGGQYGLTNTMVLGATFGSGASFRPMAFVTGTLPRLVLSTAGQNGVGTLTPGTLWDVDGDSWISGTTTTGSLIATSTLEVMGSGGVAAPDLVVFDGQTALGASNPSYKLQVMGTGLFQSNLDIGGSSNQGTINVGNGISATSTLSGEYGKLGLGTTSPYAQFAIEAVQGVVGSSTPIFAIGDSGTTTPLFSVSGIDGSVGVGTETPSARFAVTGTGTAKLRALAVADVNDLDTFYVRDDGGVQVGVSLNVGTTPINLNRGAQIFNSAGPSAGSGVYGVYAKPTRTTAGNDLNFSALVAEGILSGAVTATSYEGLQVVNPTNSGGTITTAYGVRIANITAGGDNYSIFTGTAQSSFGGNVGIGTTTPRAKLGVAAASTTPGIMIQTTGNTGEGTIAIAVDGNSNCRDTVDGSGTCVLNDLAELYPLSDDSEKGDIVTFDGDNPIHIKKATKEERNKLAGAISSSPAIVFEGSEIKVMGGTYEPGDDKAPLTLSGRIPVKVNLENGPITIGDPITISSFSGVGTKAITSGKVIGYALENLSDLGGQTFKKILVFANLGYWVSENTMTNNNDHDSDGSISDQSSSWLSSLLDAVKDWLKDAVIYVKELIVEKLSVGSAEKPTGVTIYDMETRQPYCFVMRGGQPAYIPGGCTFEVPAGSPAVTPVEEGAAQDASGTPPAISSSEATSSETNAMETSPDTTSIEPVPEPAVTEEPAVTPTSDSSATSAPTSEPALNAGG